MPPSKKLKSNSKRLQPTLGSKVACNISRGADNMMKTVAESLSRHDGNKIALEGDQGSIGGTYLNAASWTLVLKLGSTILLAADVGSSRSFRRGNERSLVTGG
jgi:hypothetical protein